MKKKRRKVEKKEKKQLYRDSKIANIFEMA